jgi:endonuclease/exonuclease/phosphatase (EEP) superfamily protein YafD
LLALTLLLRIVGERWWIALVVMYLPRWGFALPLPIVAWVVWRWGPRRLLALQLVSVVLLLVPLMGLVVNPTREAQADGPVRVLSYNIDGGRIDAAAVVHQIDQLGPDVVLLQEGDSRRAQPIKDHFGAGWHTHDYDQFFLATRYPIREAWVPPRMPPPPVPRSPRFVRYTLETPLGLIDVVNMHPISPREGLDELRGDEGFTHEVRTGRILRTRAGARIRPNTELRRRQVEAVAGIVRASARPLIVAGDTNLPGLSVFLGMYLGKLQDGFTSVGRGFGYTFPANHPWMRIDRIMASDHLRFTRFETGTEEGSDHLCVFATLAARS